MLAVLPVDREDGLGLDRVAEGRAGPVRLDRVHIGRHEPGVGEGGPEDPLLGAPVGGGEAVGGAVGVDGGTADDGQHGVALGFGDRLPRQHEHAHALGPPGAVGVRTERPAPAVRRHRALAGELHQHPGR